MSSHESLPHPGGFHPLEDISDFTEHQQQRLNFVGIMVGTIGVSNTLRAVYERRVHGLKEIDVEVANPALRHSLHMTTRPSDIWTFAEVFKQKVYDLPESVDDQVNGKPVVDIGAYIGITPAYFASRYPDSKVLAVEPHPRNWEHLVINTARYAGQIEAIHAGASPDKRPLNMKILGGSEANYVSNQFSGEAGQKDMAQVRVLTPADILDELGAVDRIGLLKIDIEGAEKGLFGSDTIDPLLDKTDVLLVETHDNFEVGSRRSVYLRPSVTV